MRRYLKLIVVVAGVMSGACAAHVKPAVEPLLPPGPTIVVEQGSAEPEIAKLPIMRFTLTELAGQPAIAAEPACDVLRVMRTPDPEFDRIELDVGTGEVAFTEVRNGRVKKLSEPVQELGLRIVDPETCRTDIVVVAQRGSIFTASAGWNIEPRTQENGVRWNKGWSTDWRVLSPPGRLVVEVRFPIETEEKVARRVRLRSGRIGTVYDTKRVITYDRYFPYNPELHDAAAVARGQGYNRQLVDEAFAQLRAAGIRSKAFSTLLVTDVPQLKQEYFERLPLIEWTDWGNFIRDPKQTVEYFWIKVGNNGGSVARYSYNRAGARGYLQFTNRRNNGTYAGVRKAYPAAQLTHDFTVGAHDHLNAMKAAILLHDLNLADLMRKHGPGIADDPRLEEFLAARYNASPKSVDKSLRPALKTGQQEWTTKLLRETKEYIAKLRYLRDRYPSEVLAVIAPPNR